MNELVTIDKIPGITGLTIGTIRNYRSTGRLPDADEMAGRTPQWRYNTIHYWNLRRLGRPVPVVDADNTVQVRRALERATSVRFEGDTLTPSDVDWDDVTDVDEALSLWRFAQTQLAAAKQVSRVAGEVLAAMLGNGGAAAYGDTIIRFKKKAEERCIDPHAFNQYLTAQVKSDFVDLGAVINPNNVKRSWMDPAVRETFYEWIIGEPNLAIVPRDKAPKFLQGLSDGEVIFGKHDDDS